MFDAILFFGKLIFGPSGIGEAVGLSLAVVIWLDTVPKGLRMRPRFVVFALLAAAMVLSSGLVVGALVGYAVMFGPSYLTGDFIGLPWLTMLPAIGLGGLAGAAAAGTTWVVGKRALQKMVGQCDS